MNGADAEWPPADGGRAEPWDTAFFARGFDWWRARRWHKEALPINMDHLTNAARFQINALLETSQAGRDYARRPPSR